MKDPGHVRNAPRLSKLKNSWRFTCLYIMELKVTSNVNFAPRNSESNINMKTTDSLIPKKNSGNVTNAQKLWDLRLHWQLICSGMKGKKSPNSLAHFVQEVMKMKLICCNIWPSMMEKLIFSVNCAPRSREKDLSMIITWECILVKNLFSAIFAKDISGLMGMFRHIKSGIASRNTRSWPKSWFMKYKKIISLIFGVTLLISTYLAI